MKLLGIVAMSLCLSGCLIDMLMTTAITADMAAQQASSASSTMNQTQIDIAMMELQEALDYHYMEKESYPRDLSALVPTYIAAIPTRPDGEPFGYNPIEGTIYENNKGPSTADYLLMEDIKVAINNFGHATGLYPRTLDDLYPNYMPILPRTSTGAPFGYDNQNGALTHPSEGQQYASETVAEGGESGSVKPVNALGSLDKSDLKDSNSLNNALDRIGY